MANWWQMFYMYKKMFQKRIPKLGKMLSKIGNFGNNVGGKCNVWSMDGVPVFDHAPERHSREGDFTLFKKTFVSTINTSLKHCSLECRVVIRTYTGISYTVWHKNTIGGRRWNIGTLLRKWKLDVWSWQSLPFDRSKYRLDAELLHYVVFLFQVQ